MDHQHRAQDTVVWLQVGDYGVDALILNDQANMYPGKRPSEYDLLL